jgi:SAM-dependent methyltransferase
MTEKQLKIKNKIIEVTNKGLTDKSNVHSYDEIYPILFENYLDKEIDIFEIGTGFGGGLLILSEVFPKANIYAIDHNYTGPYCLYPEYLPSDRDKNQIVELSSRNITFLEPMDQSDPRILDLTPKFDIIIEDASHQYNKSMESFDLLKNKLKPGGIYIIEDIYPEFLEKYRNDQRFKIFDLRNQKGRQDDVLCVYYAN